MRYLVTGSYGFIGSHLVERLLGGGHQVIGVDDFSTGKLNNLKEHPNLITMSASIMDNINSFFERVDIVFHLAAMTRPQQSIDKPMDTTTINVLGTLNILELSRANGVRRVVFASSGSIYGTQEIMPISEDVTLKPLSPYGLTKLVGEQYCKLFWDMYGLQYNCIRPFNVYGSRQNPEGGYVAAVPSFINKLKNDEPGQITGDGEQSRDFTYVDDVVEAMILASESKVFAESFNAGAGRNVSINELYNNICRIMGKDIKPVYVAPVLEPPMTLADISKAKKLLGWQPKTKLEDGLRKTIYG